MEHVPLRLVKGLDLQRVRQEALDAPLLEQLVNDHLGKTAWMETGGLRMQHDAMDER